jgi:hypothetical protein
MSYTGNPGSSDIDKVRFLLGDTDETSEQLTDDEITWMLTEETDAYAAASLGASALAAKYARLADRDVGDLSIKYSQLSKNFSALAKQLENQGATSAAGFKPYCGGISISDKDSQKADADRVPPSFRIGIHDQDEDNQTELYGGNV